MLYAHKGSKRGAHKHPSHPYKHPRARTHRHGPKSRIRDRKGKKFRGKVDRAKPRKSGSYQPRKGGKRKRWD